MLDIELPSEVKEICVFSPCWPAFFNFRKMAIWYINRKIMTLLTDHVKIVVSDICICHGLGDLDI